MNSIDDKYTETMQEKEKLRQWMFKVFEMDPARRKAYLAKYGMSEADFAAQGMLQAQQVEGGEPVGGELNKETKPAKEGVGVEPVSILEDPGALLGAALGTVGASLVGIGRGAQILTPLLYSVLFGKEVAGTAALSGAGPALQAIAEFIGNLSNPAGEEKILAQYGPEVLAEAKSAMGAEANVTILEKLKAGIESGEIKPGKIPMNLLSKVKGILKAPDDAALRALKAGFVSPETESALFAAQSRRINRINHILEVMKSSTPEEIQALMPSLADEFLKFQQLATNKISTIDKEGRTIFRLAKVELSPEDLQEIGKFAERTEFPRAVNRLFKSESGKGGLGEAGSSQLISDISSKLYTFGKSIMYGNKGETPMQRLLQAEYDAQLMNPAIPIRKAVTDLAFVPFTRVAQSLAMIKQHRSLEVGTRSLIASLMAYKESLPEALRLMKLAMKTGEPEFERMLADLVPEGKDVTKYGLSSRAQVGYAEAFDFTPPGQTGNYLGSMYSIGPRAIMSVDQFAKVLANRSGMFMLAFDHALEEIEAGGKIIGQQKIVKADEMAHKLMENPPKWLLKASNLDMYKTTFTDSNALIKGLTYLTREYPALRVLFPYIRTPINLYKEGLKMTPLGFGMSMLDESGSLERSTTQAKAALGSLFATWIAYEVMAGNITGSGPTDPKHYNMVLKPPYSAWGFSYKHLGPFAAYIALIADATEGLANVKDPGSKEEMSQAVVKAIATSLSNAPTLEGMSNLVDAMEEAKSSKYYGLEKVLGQTAAGFIPAPIRLGTQISDPVYHQARGIVDRVLNNTPLRQGIPYRKWDGTPQYLPPGVDAEGTPPTSTGVALNMLNPAPYMQDTQDDLDKELERFGIEFARPPQAININGNMTPLTPQQQDRYAILAGGNDEETKYDGMSQRERGNDLLTKDYYVNAPDDETRKALLKANHYLFTGKAEQIIRNEIPPVSFTEDFPAQPLPQGTGPGLGE